jgi:hypothetical protein
MSSSVFGATGVSGAGFGMFAPEAAPDPSQPAWMTSFQDTLTQIHDKGFQAYAKDLNEEKLAELRKTILEKMGLSEDDLGKMSAEQRNTIEKMIADEIRERLAAQAEMKAKGKDGEENGIDARAVKGPDGLSPADRAAKIATEASAPNGFGPGMTLIRAMETNAAIQAGEAQKKDL